MGGTSLGKYLITGVLGRGGMGVVLKAHDPLIERDVAIKVLSEHLATDPTALKRFLAEARAAGRLSHPNVVSVFEVGQQGDLHYLVLEFVAGGSLGEMLENSGALTALEATQATIDAARGIASAHEAGLIHRDVKPANFMRSTDGAIKVTDFGLVKSNTTQSQQVTQAGTVLGTPFYMSPEQCTGQPIDARSDIYSLGATYYSLLTGQDPFHAAAGIPQIMYAHCYGPIPDPSSVNPSVPLACSRIVARAMAKAPNDRYQTMQEMLTDLEHVRATMSGQNISALPSESGSFSPTPAMGPAMSSGSRFQRRHLLAATGATAALLLIAWWVLGRPTHMPDNIPHDQAAAPLLATDQPIKLGVLCSLSGTMADSESVLVEALLFGVDEINQSGGVLGRPLQLVVADGKSDAEMFAREAERLISAEQVHALLGCWTSDSRKAVRAVVERHDHLLIYPVQYEGLEASPSVVYLGAAPNQQILPAVHWARNSLGKNRFFLVGSDYLFPRAAHAIICDELDRLDAEVVGEHYLHLGASDVKPLRDELVAAQPDIISNSTNGDSNISFWQRPRGGITSEACPYHLVQYWRTGIAEL